MFIRKVLDSGELTDRGLLFPDGEFEVFQHLYGTGFAAFEVGGVEAFACDKFIGSAADGLGC